MTKSAATRLHEDVQDLSIEIAENLGDAARKTGDEASAALHRSSELLGKASVRLGQDLRRQARVSSGQAWQATRTHPVAAAALVGGAAALIGYLLLRDRPPF